MSHSPRRIKAPWIVGVVVVLVLPYMMSYPLIIRHFADSSTPDVIPLSFYVPVERLLDHTVVNEPMKWWARIRGAENEL